MIIKIKNLRVEAVIGVYDTEKKYKQPLLINLEIDYNEGVAPKTDRIDDTLNYHTVTDRVREYVENTKFDLLEKLVEEISKIVLSYEKVHSVSIQIDKPEAPIQGIESVSVSKIFKK